MIALRPVLGTALLALCLMFFLVAGDTGPAEIAAPIEDTDQSASASLSEASFERPEIAPIDLQPLLARPLFEPGRRPHLPQSLSEDAPANLVQETLTESMEPVPEETPPDDVPVTDLRLLGVVTADERAAALIALAGGAATWVLRGETIEGWTLERVELRSVELSRGQQRVRVEIFQ